MFINERWNAPTGGVTVNMTCTRKDGMKPFFVLVCSISIWQIWVFTGRTSMKPIATLTISRSSTQTTTAS